MTRKFKAYSDCQHGWVAVKRELLTELGIENQITHCSYQRGDTVYLEEDCDLATFITAYKDKTGHKPQFTCPSYSVTSRIRSYPRYEA